MKTIEELFNEIKKDEKLKEEGIAAIQEGKLGAFMKAHGCDASEKEAIARLDEILPRVREYSRDIPEGTIITEPYYTDIPVGVMTKEVFDMYVQMIKEKYQ